LVGSFFTFISVGADDATNRTNGSVVFASGSPYNAVEFEGKVYEPGQGNNMYIFPGIGMAAILSMARHVTDSMVEQASIALAGSLTDEEKSSELVYPRLTRIRDISAQIGLAVIRAAQKDVSASDFTIEIKTSHFFTLI
jgi:malate dehydrogenase (oxaloacetate-decarboxylating)(NADP+)